MLGFGGARSDRDTWNIVNYLLRSVLSGKGPNARRSAHCVLARLRQLSRGVSRAQRTWTDGLGALGTFTLGRSLRS